MSLNREREGGGEGGRGRGGGVGRIEEGGSNTAIKKFLQKSGRIEDDNSTETRIHY